MQVQSSASVSGKVTTQEHVDQIVDEFRRLLQEGLLVDSYDYELDVTYRAYSMEDEGESLTA